MSHPAGHKEWMGSPDLRLVNWQIKALEEDSPVSARTLEALTSILDVISSPWSCLLQKIAEDVMMNVCNQYNPKETQLLLFPMLDNREVENLPFEGEPTN